MITKGDLFKSSWEYEKANERIEKNLGNYLYRCLVIPMSNKVINCFWKENEWIVETSVPFNGNEEDLSFATYSGRGALKKLI